MKSLIAAAVAAVALGTVVTAVPVQASEPGRKYASCVALNRAYPAGVALSKASAARAVRDGMNRPRAAVSVYLDNRRLDRDVDGVACEVKVAPSGITVVPTGNALWDGLVKAQADTGAINQAQVTAITALFLRLRAIAPAACPSLRGDAFKAAFLDQLVTPDNLANLGLTTAQGPWMREQAGFAVGIACAEAGLS